MTHVDSIEPEHIRVGLRTSIIGRNLVYFSKTDSTNSQARSLADQGAPEGTVVIADEQTAGYGRLGRPWLSPPSSSLLFSVVFRPSFDVQLLSGMTMISGLSVRAAVLLQTHVPVRLKWPNDIVLKGKKLGGILTEVASTARRIEHAVVGIGLNVNLEANALPPQFRATSLLVESGGVVPRASLLALILTEMESRYVALCSGQWPVREWESALDTIGRRVAIQTRAGVIQGYADSVRADGGLVIRQPNGQTVEVVVGDVVAAPEETP